MICISQQTEINLWKLWTRKLQRRSEIRLAGKVLMWIHDQNHAQVALKIIEGKTTSSRENSFLIPNFTLCRIFSPEFKHQPCGSRGWGNSQNEGKILFSKYDCVYDWFDVFVHVSLPTMILIKWWRKCVRWRFLFRPECKWAENVPATQMIVNIAFSFSAGFLLALRPLSSVY